MNEFFMELSLKCANKCKSTSTAYNVGAVLVHSTVVFTEDLDVNDLEGRNLLFTGYSRELPGNTHAEQVCLLKHGKCNLLLQDYILYTTMEPCSERLSGKLPCAQNIIDSHGKQLNITKVYVACSEPSNFVYAKGISLLQQFGIKVEILSQYREPALLVNKHIVHQ
eukprot:NODE_264_length_12431_cov_0.389556.p4 type:complete len:166 gc:universal NODE_264_length_12431_cov_0.389556:7697-8194(+)